MSDNSTVTQQYSFTVSEDGNADGIKPAEESVETSLKAFGASVDHRERDTRIDQPEATSFGVDDCKTVTRGDGGTSHMLNTKIGEPGWLGNPHTLSDGYSRAESIRCYWEDFHSRLGDNEFCAAVEALRGQTLACYCKPKACHGDVIVEYLND